MLTPYVYQLLGGGNYSKEERVLVKFSFSPLGHKPSQFCDVTP